MRLLQTMQALLLTNPMLLPKPRWEIRPSHHPLSENEETEATTKEEAPPIIAEKEPMVEKFKLPRTHSRSRDATPINDEEVKEVAQPENSSKQEVEESIGEAQEGSNKKRRV